MRFLLLLLLLPITYSLTINATGYTPDGVSYLVKQEVSAMNEIIDQCVTSSIGKFPFDIGNMHRSEADQMTHSAARCLFFQHHMRTSVRNQYTMIDLIKKLQELFIEDASLHLDIRIEVENTTSTYMSILIDIQKEILAFQKQIHGYIINTAATEENQVQDLIQYLDNEKSEIDETENSISLDFSNLVDLYTYFVEKFTAIHKRIHMVDIYQTSNSTSLNDAITLFKADIIAHYLQVANILDEQGLITNAFDAYECITDNRTECIFPNAVSEHLETCSRASVLFGQNGQFLSFNSLIQVAEESMCSTNTTCIDTQDTDWTELVESWTENTPSVSTDRWICVDFNHIASNVQSSRNHLRADKHTYGKQIANYLQEQKDTNGAFNIASSGLSDAFNAFSVTTLPTYDATNDIMADVFVDDSSNTQCTIDCRNIVLDTCCIDPDALKTMFHKNNDEYKVKYSTRVKTYNPALYDRDEITITTEIAEPAVRYGYLAASESSSLVDILKLLNVTGCEKVAECKKKASDATDCTYNVNTRNENSDCDIGSLFLPDDRDTETVYTSSDLGTSSPIPLTAYTPDTTTCTVEQDTTKNTFDECKTHLIKELYHKSGSYTRNDFIFGHYTGTSCKLYKCTKTTFLENKGGDNGQLIPLKPVQNKTVIIEVLQAGNSNVNPLALACPVNYNATCTACQGGWSDGNTARGAWTNIDASKQNPANPQNWGQCSETSERKRDSTDTQNYCDTTQTKDCQLVDVTSASFDKSTGKLTVQWTNKASPLRDSINFLTIKHDNTYTIITDNSSQKVIDSATPPDIHLYRSDTSGNDLGDKTVRVCAQHVANYNAYPVTVSPGCTTASSTERQLKPITSECVVDDTSSFGACQNDNKQYKELLQIKLPYDGSDAYNGCDATRTCYVCADGDGNPSKDETNACTQCDAGFKSGPKNDKNARECVACTGDTYQNQAGQSTCPDRTICQPGQYVDDDGSSTTNRVCQPCAKGSKSTTTNQGTCDVCDGSTKYQDETGQSSCKTVSSCPAGQGVTQNATSESNTVCENCDGNTTFSDVDSKTAACKDTVTQCDAGFKFIQPTTTTKGACQECTGSTFISASNHQQTSCTTHATCVAGQYVTQTPSSIRNRLCQACPVGSVSSGENQASCTACDGTNEYQDQTGQTSCKTASTCPAGQGVTTTHTTIANTTCEDCDGTNKYSNVDSYDVCQDVDTCDATSEAESEPPTSTSDRECGCNSGFIVNGNECQQCPSGSFQTDVAHAKTTCDTWKTCAAGSYISTNGTHKIDRECSPCGVGTYSSSSNVYQCTDCAEGTYQNVTGQTSCVEDGKCGLGKGMKTTATDGSDTVCENCVAGTTFSNTDSSTEPCQSVTVASCGAGKRFVAPNATADGQCVECTTGTYISASNHQQTSCTTHATCVAGEFIFFPASSTADKDCRPCAKGSYSTGTDVGACTICDGTNEYQDQTGQTSCKTASTCEAGKGVTIAHTTIANTTCEDCDGTNKYSNVDSYDACQAVNVCAASEAELTAPTSTYDRECQCAAGYYVDAGSCQACPSGRYQPSANAVATCPNTWSNCAAGTYISVNGTTTTDQTCASCTSGSFTNAANQFSCTTYTPCGTDKYVSVNGTTTTNQTCADKKADGLGCAAGQECTSGSCDSGTCGTSCNNNTDCTASQYCDVSGLCKDKVGQNESCGITYECLDNLFCNQHLENAACKTCDDADDAAYGDWTADGSCTSGGWQVDTSPVPYGSTSSTKYLTETDAQNACTSSSTCQGITRWAVDTGSNGCGSDYARFDSSSMCFSVGALIYGSTSNGNGCYTGDYAFANGADCVSESQMTCAYKNEHGYYNRQYGKQCTSSRSCVCQYWTIDDGSNNPDTTADDIADALNKAISSKTLQNNQPLIRSTEDTDVCTDTSKTIACGTCPDGTECPSGQTCNTDLNPNTCEASGGGDSSGACGDNTNQNDCVGDCVWDGSTCNEGGGSCGDNTNQNDCVGDCVWEDGTCNDSSDEE